MAVQAVVLQVEKSKLIKGMELAHYQPCLIVFMFYSVNRWRRWDVNSFQTLVMVAVMCS